MGFPFMMWGGGDGSSEVARGGTASEAGTAGVAGAAGAAGAMGGPRREQGLSEEEQIYGPQPTSREGDYPSGMPRGPPGQASDGWAEEPGFYPDQDEVMHDPWGGQSDDGGLFGGGGDGGDWGDWGS